MHIDRTVGFADWPQTEVVGPTDQHPIEPFHNGLRILPDFVTSGFVADRSTDALHSFLRRCIPESQTSLPADNRPASSSRSPSVSASTSSPASRIELAPLQLDSR